MERRRRRRTSTGLPQPPVTSNVVDGVDNVVDGTDNVVDTQ